jgi:hypothetical protein
MAFGERMHNRKAFSYWEVPRFLAVTLLVAYVATRIGTSLANRKQPSVARPSPVMKWHMREIASSTESFVASQPALNSYAFVKDIPGEPARLAKMYEKLMGYQGREYDSKKAGWVRTRARTPEDELFRDFEVSLSGKMNKIANDLAERHFDRL